METQHRNAVNIWKNKAKERQIENKDLRKRLKESKTSRDQWKQKAFERKEEIKALEIEIDRIKKNLMKIIG
jgi:hypothetical protein